MELVLGILQVLGIFVVLPALVGIVIVGFFQPWKHWASRQAGVAKLVCSVDTDCPSGFVCMGGRCVPSTQAQPA